MANSLENLFHCFDEESSRAIPVEHEETAPLSNRTNGNNKRENEDAEIDSPTKKSKTEEMMEFEDLNLEELQNRIVVHEIESMPGCTHEVAYPPGQEYAPLKACPIEEVRYFPFALDPFQRESMLCIGNIQSILVSAHTSSGKTAIAEYAVALSFHNHQRVIYTTPIKALSNQKYREFHKDFKDVGLITGDVTINPSASCLIMTTEVLRNMLYRGSEIIREVGWVIFDEIHYMRDKERGVVWEESLILLPHNVHFVFLSATIPNARQFAEWVAHLHRQPCHVVYTDYRPTPLQHFIYPAGGSGIYTVLDENGTFKEDSFNAAMAVLQNSGDAARGHERGRRGGFQDRNAAQTDIFKIVNMIMERNFAPVIIFSFSKKDCEVYAMQMLKLDFNKPSEKILVDEVFRNAMQLLSEDDRNLPQVQNLLPLLRRGIGIHHGGLLPILKETIEILFAEGLIKTLFATETFAMGLNMPARTVVFSGMRKFDGQEYRWITSGEYVQMSGRAGRRGLDDKGVVILMVDEKVPPSAGKNIIKGRPDSINSAFHLTYNMVLNLLRVEEINPEYMLERSFFQFQNQTAIPGLYEKYNQKLQESKSFQFTCEDEIASYYEIRQELDKLGFQFKNYLTKSDHLVPFLQTGRLVKVKVEGTEYGWGAIVGLKKVEETVPGRRDARVNPAVGSTKIQVSVLLHVLSEDGSDNKGVIPKPCPDGQQGEVEIINVDSSFITHLSSVRVFCPEDFTQRNNRKSVYNSVKEVEKRYPGGPPLLNPINDMKITDPEFAELVNKIQQLEKKMYDHPLHEHSLLNTEYEKYAQKVKCNEELAVAHDKLAEAKSILQLDELKCRKRVLRRLGYCSNTDVIQVKGRVACELSGADELLLTELIFNGVFMNLTPPQACSLLSTMVCDDRSNETPKLSEELSGPLRQMQELARNIAKVSTEARLPLEEDSYVERFKPHLMDVVYAWCNGTSFGDVCKMTDIFEGSIVRCLRRLEELLRQMVQASKTIGNADMEETFNTGIKLIKRDIVFSSSLYL